MVITGVFCPWPLTDGVFDWIMVTCREIDYHLLVKQESRSSWPNAEIRTKLYWNRCKNQTNKRNHWVEGHFQRQNSDMNFDWIIRIFLVIFYVQHRSSKLFKVFTWNFIHISRILFGGLYSRLITLAFILTVK